MFEVGSVIKINRKEFTIKEVNENTLVGTLEGDPAFLAGKRTVARSGLAVVKSGYSYIWNSK